jgi:glycosyltransferase involved in cell wall biosynthesis
VSNSRYKSVTRFILIKLLQIWEIITGQRRHPILTISRKAYLRWVKKNTPSPQELKTYAEASRNFKIKPLISIVMPIYNTDKQWLEEAFVSIIDQVYSHWELCIVDDGSTAPHVKKVLSEWQQKDSRFKIKHLTKNQGIALATNQALEIACGEFIAFMDSDDTLHPCALFEVVKLLNQQSNADVIYTDEDKLSLEGKRHKPVFKPNWSEQRFLTHNYINHLTVCRKGIIEKVGGFRKTYDWSQDYDLYLRVTETTTKIYHIPLILYHWRAIPGSSAAKVDFRTQALDASKQLLKDTLQRRGIEAMVSEGIRPGTFKVRKKNAKKLEH